MYVSHRSMQLVVTQVKHESFECRVPKLPDSNTV